MRLTDLLQHDEAVKELYQWARNYFNTMIEYLNNKYSEFKTSNINFNILHSFGITPAKGNQPDETEKNALCTLLSRYPEDIIKNNYRHLNPRELKKICNLVYLCANFHNQINEAGSGVLGAASQPYWNKAKYWGKGSLMETTFIRDNAHQQDFLLVFNSNKTNYLTRLFKSVASQLNNEQRAGFAFGLITNLSKIIDIIIYPIPTKAPLVDTNISSSSSSYNK